MKKLLALLLSVMMAASLAVPAFADGPGGPAPADGDAGYFVNGEPVPVYTPGEAIPISAILDSLTPEEALGIIGGADGPTSILTSGPLGSFDWDDIGELPDPDSADWAELGKELQQMRDENKKALGGVPGQVGVMVDGVYVKFPDAAPEVTGGRTMVPVRALVETLGGEVEYQAGAEGDTIRFVIDGYVYEFAIGSTTVKVSPTADDDKDTPQPDDIQMDCAPYIKGGRTYVPIRFISEALGYEVGWDAYYETAILLDREALADKIDEKFTILNKVQANRLPELTEGQSLQAEAKGKVSVTVFDTLNGNKTYSADLAAKQLMNDEAASGSMSVDMSGAFLDMLMEQTGMDEEAGEAVQLVVDLLKDLEYILGADGKMFFHADALDRLADKGNVWLGVDVSEALAEMGQAGLVVSLADASELTIGSTLVQMMPCESVSEWSSVMEMADLLDSLYGDDKFTTSGGVSTLTIGVDDLFDLYKDMGLSEDDIAEAKAVFKEYEITMKVDAKGGADVVVKMETAAQAGVPAIKLDMSAQQSAEKVTMTVSGHIANLGEMKLEATQTQKATSDKPMSEPPAGSTIVDVDNGAELLEP